MAIYYCHKCQERCNISMDGNEVQCARCHDTFVEELPAVMSGSAYSDQQSPTIRTGNEQIVIGSNPFDMFPTSPFSRLFSRVIPQTPRNVGESSSGMPSAARTRSNSHLNTAGSSRQQNQPDPAQQTQGTNDEDQMANFLQQILSNILSQSMRQEEPGTDDGDGRTHFSIRFIAGPSSAGQGIFSVHSNVNDYAWGPNGLDNILTALLNQFDENQERARALRPEDIKRLPMTKVTNKHVENGTHCTTCMESFELSEDVAKLDCDHIFHRACIEPWLQRNNTCPICRKEIDPSHWEPKIADIDELD